MHHTLTSVLARLCATTALVMLASCSSPYEPGANSGDVVASAADAAADAGGGSGRDDDAATPKLPTDLPPSGNFVFPAKIYSGFDGTNVYKVPVTTMLGDRDGDGAMTGDVAWASSDPSVATIEKVAKPADEKLPTTQWAMITTKKVGKTTITATKGPIKATAEVTVNSYTVEQNTAGKTRYTTAGETFAGSKCTTCHGGATGVDHSPTRIGAYDDVGLVAAITTAAYPDGRKLALTNHKWLLTDAEKVGIASYLRSLPPHGF